MKISKVTVLIVLIVSLFISISTFATLPTPVASTYVYQGTIFVDDFPFGGTGFFKLAIVNNDGATLWSNDGTSADGSEPSGSVAVTVNDGVFAIILGDTSISGMSAIDPTVFVSDGTLFLKTWFDDGARGFGELSPPITITANAYSINSQYLRGYAPDDFFLNSSKIVSSQIAAGAVQTVNIAGGAVGSTQIADDAVTSDKIQAFSNARTFNVGDATVNNVTIVASIGAANNPALRYDTASSAWQLSNDGTTWSDIGTSGGSGTVNPGAIDQIAYYSAAGNAVSGSNSLPALVQGNITQVGTITTGVWNGTAIDNAHVADDLTINGGLISVTPINGSEIGAILAAKGTFTDLIAQMDAVIEGGDATLGEDTVGYAGRIVMHDAQVGNAKTTTIKANDNITNTYTLTLPADYGSAGQVLSTDAAGNLSWITAATGDVTGPASSTDTAVARYSGTTGKIIQNSGVTIDGSNNVGGIVALSIDSMGKDWTNAGRTVADLGSVTTADINGGTIDNAVIGGSAAADGTFDDLLAATLSLSVQAKGDILYNNGTSFVPLNLSATDGQVLTVNAVSDLPEWRTLPSSGVTSLDGLAGALTIANSSGAGSTITMDNASTAAKGIASFNATNFSVAAGAVNTIQNITTTSSPSFSGLTVSGLSSAGVVHNDAGGVLSTGSVNMSSEVTGTLSEANGGTNQSTYTTGQMLYASGANVLSKLNIGSAGQVLTVNGGVPSWQNAATGDVTGPASSTDTSVARYSGTTGKIIQDSGVTIDGSNNVGGVAALSIDSMGKDWTNAGRTVADLGSVTTADINGGSVDGTTVGGSTPAAGTFTSLQTGVAGTSGQLTIYSEQGATDYSVVFQPDAAMTETTTYTLPPDNGANGQVLATDGSGGLSWNTLPVETVYSETTVKTGAKVWSGTATTTSGSATLYPTSDGTAGGTALFTNVYAIHVTAEYNTSDANSVSLASVRSLSADKKTLIVNAVKGTTVILGGSTLTDATDGTKIYATIIGD